MDPHEVPAVIGSAGRIRVALRANREKIARKRAIWILGTMEEKIGWRL